VARGAVVAQFNEEPRDKALGLRVTQTALDRLEAALAEEKKDPRNRNLAASGLAARLLDLGLAVYAAREKAGIDRFREVARAHGGDEAEALADLLERGLASWLADHPATKGKK
jgi:hypothetical protein